MADDDAATKAQASEQEQDEAKKEMEALEEGDPPENLEDWPDGKAKYETFGGATVREVHDRLSGEREIAYTTVMTVLDRLAKKDLVTRERDGRAWRYFPADTREALTAQTMRRTLDDMEVTDRRTALLHFLDGATSDELDDLKAALAEIESRAGPQHSP